MGVIFVGLFSDEIIKANIEKSQEEAVARFSVDSIESNPIGEISKLGNGDRREFLTTKNGCIDGTVDCRINHKCIIIKTRNGEKKPIDISEVYGIRKVKNA